MLKTKFYADTPTLELSKLWFEESIDKLSLLARDYVKLFSQRVGIHINFVSLSPDGKLVVSFIQTPPAAIRGTILLDLEEYLKQNLDVGVTVWHEALGDKNSLRILRGIEVK